MTTNWKTLETNLTSRAWEDADFKATLLRDAGEAVALAGLTLPEETEFRVVAANPDLLIDETPGVHYMVLASGPEDDEDEDEEEFELDEDDLDEVAGGTRGAPTMPTFGGQRACGC